MEKKKTRHAKKPDSQPFDEVRITTVPRYKTSDLSGDEWRISSKIELMRKGKVVHEQSMGRMESAVNSLGYIWGQAMDEMKGYYNGGEDGKCDQEGCSEIATVFYRVKKEFCRDNPYKHPAEELNDVIVIRQFCKRHSTRGDCAFDDADNNYELIDGSIVKPRDEDNSPSVFGGVVKL